MNDWIGINEGKWQNKAKSYPFFPLKRIIKRLIEIFFPCDEHTLQILYVTSIHD